LIESVKAGGGEGALFDRWSSQFASLVQVRQRLDLSVVPLSVLPPMLGSIAVAAVLGVGALFVLRGDITIGTLVLFQVLMAGFLTPLASVVSLGSNYQQVAGMLDRLDDVLMAAPDSELAVSSDGREAGVANGASPPRLEGELEVRGVTFGYCPADPPLVSDLWLHLQPGQRVALVGPTGSGKSTVSRLVTGLYQPWTGDVLLDRRPRAVFPRHTITNSIALVDQQIMLFEGSVRDNLTLWDQTVPHAELVRAASDAQILTTILGRPGSFDAHVEEGGRNFSGGERQQLEIARALVRRPSLLVLDEATSSLDPPTEYAIDLALRRRGCACLIVAHRLSTIRDADHIVVLANGQVVEQGTHEELLAYGGRYAALVLA
jgi:ABC-type bacteriocin/lantibiotic exporter with double-glycine peptidase domain